MGNSYATVTITLTVAGFRVLPNDQILVFLRKDWRRRPDLNRGWRFCRPLTYHLATAPLWLCRGCTRWDSCPTSATAGRRKVERETGFEPATSTLARSHSTTELFPPASLTATPKCTTAPRRQASRHPVRARARAAPRAPGGAP